jgi:hypothetical protein
MRCRAVLHVIACLLASLAFGMPAFAADDLRVSEPIIHDNLSIYLLHGSAARGAVPLTLQEALAAGSVKVEETGSVNALTVENTGTEEVFVQAGDIVKGGRQDRVLSVDLLLPPRSGRTAMAAFCVEAERWSARGDEDPRHFSSANAAMPAQEAKLAMRTHAAAVAAVTAAPRVVAPAVAPEAASRSAAAEAYAASSAVQQEEVWKTVKITQERLSHALGERVIAPTSPSSLELSLENEKLKEAQAAYLAALVGAGEAADGIVGYVFAINGKIEGGDVYASNALFRKMWRKQLAANVTEAIAKKDMAGAAVPSVKEVEAFLAAPAGIAKAERAVNANVRLATAERDSMLYAETRRPDGSWVHKNYLVR